MLVLSLLKILLQRSKSLSMFVLLVLGSQLRRLWVKERII